VYFEYICWKFAGRLLDRVNTPLDYMSSAGSPPSVGPGGATAAKRFLAQIELKGAFLVIILLKFSAKRAGDFKLNL